MRVRNPDRSPLGINRSEHSPNSTRLLLSLLAMISQYFTRAAQFAFTDYSEQFAVRAYFISAVRSISAGPQ
jgi:hypothetical protein